MEIIIATFNYVTQAQYFWQVMACSFIMAMYIGAIVHNGDLEGVRKSILSIGSYVSMLLLVNISRINTAITLSGEVKHSNLGMAYASAMTTVLLSIFWFAGLIFGVYIVRKIKNKHQVLA